MPVFPHTTHEWLTTFALHTVLPQRHRVRHCESSTWATPRVWYTPFPFVAQDVALHKVSAPEASCTPLLVTPARANGTEWFTAFPAAQEVAVHEVSAPEASCTPLLVTPARANGTEWFTAFPAAQEVAVHEVSAPEDRVWHC
jgi:hypothetical protein